MTEWFVTVSFFCVHSKHFVGCCCRRPQLPTMNREDVEFRTFDGLTLRGWLYPGTIRGPAIVMNQGVRMTLLYPYL
jgi:hypothetical protein